MNHISNLEQKARVMLQIEEAKRKYYCQVKLNEDALICQSKIEIIQDFLKDFIDIKKSNSLTKKIEA